MLNRVMQHVFRFENVSLSSWYLVLGVFKNPLFWVEIFLVGVHCPPGFDEGTFVRSLLALPVLYSCKSTNTDCRCLTQTTGTGLWATTYCIASKLVLSLLALLVQKYEY